MLVLALDTATANIALALADVAADGSFTLLASDDAPAPRCANAQLISRVRNMMEPLGLQPSDLQELVCGRGPGSFTGVRIGVATAKGMACGLHLPLHGVSSLDALACCLWLEGRRGQLGIVADAMRGEIYPLRYFLDDKGPQRQGCECVAKAAPVAADWAALAREPLYIAGDGLAKYAEAFSSAFAEAGKSELLELAQGEANTLRGVGLISAYSFAAAANLLDSGDAGSLLPIYTRLSDAEEHERQRLGQLEEQLPPSGVAELQAAGGLILRPLRRSDLPALLDVARASFLGAAAADIWSEGMLLDEFGRKDRSWWVAWEGGQLLGYAGGWVIDGCMHLLEVAVHPQQRRQGIARRLLERLCHDAQDLGASSITLEVREDNAVAQSFYRGLGLAPVGRRPRYYPDGSAALLMTGPLPLSPAPYAAAKGGIAGMELQEHLQHNAPAAQAAPADSATPADSVDKPSQLRRPLILAIESSCDETAAAVIDGDGVLHADCLASQIDFHSRFGGVVPEIASRKHTEAIVGVVEEALALAAGDLAVPELDFKDLSAIAVTSCPGLVGALVVGLAFAKGLSWACDLPLIEVNHLEGHLYANRLLLPDIKPPLVALLVSGGHTMLVHVKDWGSYQTLGSTLDDAAGEAFDKVAKALGLGYPGGPIISRLAKSGDPRAIDFPRAMMHSGDYMFSLSGLKTAVISYIHNEEAAGRPINLPDLAASFQQAVVDVQVAKAVAAVKETGVSEFCLGGGVAANPALREGLLRAMSKLGVRATIPPLSSCTDNAGMIAAVALDRYNAHKYAPADVDVRAHAPLDQEY